MGKRRERRHSNTDGVQQSITGTARRTLEILAKRMEVPFEDEILRLLKKHNAAKWMRASYHIHLGLELYHIKRSTKKRTKDAPNRQ